MFSKLMERQLVFSMHLDLSKHRIVRFFGKLLGVFPLWYARCLEKKGPDDYESF